MKQHHKQALVSIFQWHGKAEQTRARATCFIDELYYTSVGF